MISKRDWCFALFIVCIIYFCDKSEGRRIYYRGRRYDGFVGTPKIPANVTVPKDEWFEQRLDHFNPTDAKMFQQRYFTNASFHVPGGPVFLLIGGESEASPDWMVQGQWIIYAQKYKALCFQLEHRFYGQSHPTRSLTAKSLQYLTSQQALADLAYFIKKISIKYELPPGTKWIVFGGSYPGSLAAWMRAKYPHLVHGAVSGSAPLLAKADFKEYLRIVKDDLSITNKSCVVTIQEANRHLHTLMKTPMGQDTVNEIFQLCDPIDILEENDVANFYGSLASLLSGVAQYSGDNRKGIEAKININSLCEVLANESIGTPVHRYAAMIDMVLSSDGEECLDYKYENMITEMSQVDWESEEVTTGGRQWFYQTCTEFGFYQTSSLTADLFGDEFPLEFFVQQCSDVFGPRYNKEQIMRGIEMTNTMYGALHIEASRVVYIQGSLDPWHALGITKTVRQDSPAIYIKGTSHCADMYEPSSNDPQALMNARKMIDDLIGLWLDED